MSRLLLVGSPNSGKSMLFNRLTGLSQKVANFPGITVDVSTGSFSAMPGVTLEDFPGTYSLAAISSEEAVAVSFFEQALDADDVLGVLCVIDVTRLEKSIYLTLQVIRECQRHGKPVTVLANMADVLESNNLSFDRLGLSEALGAPVVPVSARTGFGIDELIDHLRQNTNQPQRVDVDWRDTPDSLLRGTAHQYAQRYGARGDLLVRQQARLDRFFLGGLTGGVTFFLIMLVLFQSIFTWAAPAMDGVEMAIGALASAVVPLFGDGVTGDFVADALFGGVGAFLVFVPQIFVLTLIIGLLEDTGYLARAALICHRPLRFFGLSGKSFVPLLSGVACAIPAVYAARAVDSPRQRILTYMAIPLMPCSARLPVYALLIATFIPTGSTLGGLVGWQGLAMFSIYFFGMFMAMVISGIASRMGNEKTDELPFVLELPPYRVPGWRPILRSAINRSGNFVTKAGKIIFLVTVLIWILGYFPNYGADLGESWLGSLGRLVEPVFSPLGLDWRYGVAVLTAFAAREVFVGTLGTIFGIEGAEDNMLPLVDQIQASGLPLGSGLALLVFFAIALQCVSTVAILARESNSWSLVGKMVVGYLAVAWLLAWCVFQLGGLLS